MKFVILVQELKHHVITIHRSEWCYCKVCRRCYASREDLRHHLSVIHGAKKEKLDEFFGFKSKECEVAEFC